LSTYICDENPENIQRIQQACHCRVQNQHAQAIEILRKMDAQTGDNIRVKTLLFHCLVETNATDEMESHLERWLKSSPSDEVANHLRVAVDGMPIPEFAPSKFIVANFATQAEVYEELMKQWNYAWPACLQSWIHETGQVEKFNRVLDAGCGTGLLGSLLKNIATELVGVDLSPEMLQYVSNKGTYDQLICSDLLEFLGSHEEYFDLLVAADSFNFLGNLEPAIHKSFRALKPKGWLLFSLQEGPLDRDGYYLRMDGSFVHSPAYLIEQLGEAGVAGGTIRRVLLRQEFNEKVYGLLVAVQRPTL
jgi:predicted TPR repeat methyltransferase